MRRFIAIMMSVVLLLCSSSAFAAGKISVTQENFYAVNLYSDYGYAFAKVANVGNKPIKINAGILEIFDGDGENITSSDRMYSYAEYLEPDQYTYVYMYAKLEDGQLEKVDDYLMTITGKSDTDKMSKRLTVKGLDFKRDVPDGKYWTRDYAYFTVVNDTEETIWGIQFVYALLDAEDHILLVDNDYISSNKGLSPGSSIEIKEEMSSKWMEYYDAHDLVPAKIDVIAYVDVEN